MYSGFRGFDSHRGQKIFSLLRVVPRFPLLGLTPSGLFMVLSSTLLYNSELILCFTILKKGLLTVQLDTLRTASSYIAQKTRHSIKLSQCWRLTVRT